MHSLITKIVAALGIASAATAVSAAFPDKPIRLIVPWATGGSTDAVGRAIAQRMTATMGQTVYVENKAGAGGQLGADAAAKSAPDGYTIAIIELAHAIAPAVSPRLPYDVLRDFTPITLIGTSPLVLFTTPKTGTVQDLVKAAKANPGEVALAHSGTGSVSHLASTMLASKGAAKFNLIPYRGSGPALVDVSAGLVAGHLATLASGSSLLAAGKVMPAAVAGRQRMTALPQVPTFEEAGLKDLSVHQWWALVAPATTPIDVVEKLRSEMAAALQHPSVREQLSTLAIDLRSTQRDELRAFLRSEVERWGKIAKEVGLKAE
jgi:tripartite-type tricarboxylate transporter receptor subunit TctC